MILCKPTSNKFIIYIYIKHVTYYVITHSVSTSHNNGTYYEFHRFIALALADKMSSKELFTLRFLKFQTMSS